MYISSNKYWCRTVLAQMFRICGNLTHARAQYACGKKSMRKPTRTNWVNGYIIFYPDASNSNKKKKIFVLWIQEDIIIAFR